jgi:WD repeat-containing protein 35
MQDPKRPAPQHLLQIETKWLQDIKFSISEKKLSDALQFAQTKSQNRLWKVVAESALENMDFETATKAFIHCLDYQGLQFIKRIKKIEGSEKRAAEIATFLEQFEKAEKIYLGMDRKDLAVELRIRMGDWFRVMQLLKTGSGGDDRMLEQSWNSIGDYYYDRHNWNQAITYYLQSKNNSRLIELYFMLEDYDSVEKITRAMSENNPMLQVFTIDLDNS